MKAVAAAAIAALAVLTGTGWALGQASGTAIATFAGGCFWCVESDFDKVPGVLSTTSGFMGGTTSNPTYDQVVRGDTGHAEVVQVVYDPSKVSYEKLLDTFWRNVDPFNAHGQFCDRGSHYRPEIFAHTPEQKKLAEASKKTLVDSGRFKQQIVVKITNAGPFTAADEKHQDFYKKNSRHYNLYRTGCGRDARLEQIWGKSATH